MEFKDIVKEWQDEFPILSKYTSATLMARTDIFLIGLRLDRRWSDEYDVVLEILPLWVPKEKIIIFVLRENACDKKGFQISIDIMLHDPWLTDYVEAQKMRGAEIDIKKFELQRAIRQKMIREAMECTHEQFDAVFQQNVGLSTIFRLISNHTFSKVFDRDNPLDWYRLFELELALAYFFNREDLIMEIKREIEKEVSHWTQERFNVLFGISKEEWKVDLYRIMEDREAFMRQVEMNLSLKKISKLKQIHIHDDLEPNKTLLQKFSHLLKPRK